MTTGVSEERTAAAPAVTVRVPAKLNLALSVGRPGDDGYHPVATVYHAVSVFDHVVASPRPEGAGIAVTVEGSVPGASDVPAGPDNLAARAARLLARTAGVPADVALHVRKAIPVAGGMAGGSADAAAALVACDHLWSLGMPRDELHVLAAQLGSDVPFLLHGGTALGLDRGDRLIPVLARGGFSWVFGVADAGLSAGEVYARCDEIRDRRGYPAVPEPRVADTLLAALRSGDAQALGDALHNDLQDAAVALRPQLRQVLAAGTELGAIGAVVSGSGPTCAFLARDDKHALDLAVGLTTTGTCRTVLRAHGPVPGARVVVDEVG